MFYLGIHNISMIWLNYRACFIVSKYSVYVLGYFSSDFTVFFIVYTYLPICFHSLWASFICIQNSVWPRNHCILQLRLFSLRSIWPVGSIFSIYFKVYKTKMVSKYLYMLISSPTIAFLIRNQILNNWLVD